MLDTSRKDGADDVQLLAVNLHGKILHNSDYISKSVESNRSEHVSTEKRSIVVESHYALNIEKMDLNYCGIVYIITHLDTLDTYDLDTENNIIAIQVMVL